jgi:Flavin-binding monooxygenase-like
MCELQSRYLAQLYLGNLTLPPRAEMEKEIVSQYKFAEENTHLKTDLSLVSALNFVSYIDWLAKQIGCDIQSRLTWGLWFKNRKLYDYITKGPLSGHQYR